MYVLLSSSDVVFNFNIQYLQCNQQNNLSPGIFSLVSTFESFLCLYLIVETMKANFSKMQTLGKSRWPDLFRILIIYVTWLCYILLDYRFAFFLRLIFAWSKLLTIDWYNFLLLYYFLQPHYYGIFLPCLLDMKC